MMLIPTRHIRWISDFGKRTLAVYMYHIPIRAVFYKYHITDYFLSTYIGTVMYGVLWLMITIVLSTKIISVPTDLIKKFCYIKTKENGNKDENE